jgi:hypothetical protein
MRGLGRTDVALSWSLLLRLLATRVKLLETIECHKSTDHSFSAHTDHAIISLEKGKTF